MDNNSAVVQVVVGPYFLAEEQQGMAEPGHPVVRPRGEMKLLHILGLATLKQQYWGA